jgi:DNA invertase Pin-like site-specific DNA recombinase
MVQELGIIALTKLGVHIVTAAGDDLTDTSDPSRKMMRQIAGSFAEYEKARLVHKLREARERKKKATGKCGGRKTYAEARPEVVAMAKELRDQRMSLRKISTVLAAQGHLTATGKPYVATAVQAMLGQC